MIEFIALPFPFSTKLNIWSFHVVVVQGQQSNLLKGVMLIKPIAFSGVPVAVAFVVS